LNKFILMLIITVIAIFLFTCSESTNVEDLATLKGKVYFVAGSNLPGPLAGATVSALDYFAQSQTNANGAFEVKIDLSGEDRPVAVDLQVSKAGYETGTISVNAQRGETSLVPDLTLQQIYSDTTVLEDTISGDAAHITVDGSHSTHIYVQSSGLQETARINFVVTDDQGRLVDDDHNVLVHFNILSGPDGGEYLEPDTMRTINGRVHAVLNSGIIAGPVQLDVYADVNGQTIRALPVRMAIYGGLPDQDHFSLAVDILNIAGRVHFGIIDNITAFVGDKFSNPVAPGTIVYFSTDYCIVEGAAVTNELGQAKVQFESAAPLPPNPIDSTFAHITAWTYEDTVLRNTINAKARILLSDVTGSISINPTDFTYTAANNPITFNYVVQDVWGNPLVGNTNIKVSSTAGSLYGDVNINLVDTQLPGPGRTDLQFVWSPGDSLEDPTVFISITVSPPADGNGYRSVGLYGTRNW
jgi:hypothetical protein